MSFVTVSLRSACWHALYVGRNPTRCLEGNLRPGKHQGGYNARRLQHSCYGLGRGCGVGRTRGAGVPLGVGVGRGVGVGVTVGVVVGVAVGVTVGLGVGVEVGVAVGVTVGVAVAVAVGVGVAVGEAVGVGVGVGVGTPPGAWMTTPIGEPVLKKSTVAFVGFGAWSASNRKLYIVAKRIALAF